MAESSCIDAGDAAGAPARDIDSEERWDHPHHSNRVSIVDIGADEFVDIDGDTLPDRWEGAHDLNPLDPFDLILDPDGDRIGNFYEYI